ncbi:16S rRNA processing protein RimM [Acetobacterium paludosum]|uniref:Ribosome maturation factor RimM n=1 Tax=Acetobacterium paludosum TaxID=52693 RepID=A0A923KX55_9FIRM|nr:ribosome maturation factor RimM [Acetobacterium paludosum]MBC3888888.1 16S rRNA processing protein RimM [Acetobacterium paludosum]
MKDDSLIIIGRILGAHGIKGELKVLPLTDDPGRYYDLETITLLNGKIQQDYVITNCRLHKTNVLLFVDGVATRNDAEALIGREVGIPRDLAVKLQEDEFFIEELIGLPVYNEGALLGKITDVMQAGGVDVYTITGGPKTYCVPARKIYFKEINVNDRRIDATIPQEILDL